ncbi:hypothetical protein OHA21_19545 [Actinoplanes sp. NBC_00393]|uniref:hypothetical protein n=1 Tax=Actinoplanes sp. NBC_00393 TaxID=2975953 RepID=UPI002E1E09A8
MIKDDDLYARMRSEFEPMRLGDSVADITARGRRLRRRRHTVGALGLAAAAAATTLGLALGSPAPDRPAPAPVAAWSVDTQPDGSVRLTIRQLTDADQLSAALNRAGVPAKVEFKQLRPGQTAGCAEDDQAESPLLLRVMPMQPSPPDGDEQVFTIRRDRMPAGTSLHFVIMEQPGDSGARSRSVHSRLVIGTPRPCKLYEN